MQPRSSPGERRPAEWWPEITLFVAGLGLTGLVVAALQLQSVGWESWLVGTAGVLVTTVVSLQVRGQRRLRRRLEWVVSRQTRQLRAMADLQREVSGSLDLEQVCGAAARTTAGLVGADTASVALLEGAGVRRYGLWGVERDLLPDSFREAWDASLGVTGLVLRQRGPALVADLESAPGEVATIFRAIGMRSGAGVPLWHAGEPIGAVVVGWADPAQVPSGALVAMQGAASTIAASVANALHHGESEGRRAMLERLTVATREISAARTPEAVRSAGLSQASRIARGATAMLARAGAEAELATLSWEDEGIGFRCSGTAIGVALLTDRTTRLAAASGDHPNALFERSLVREVFGGADLLSVPLSIGPDRVGVLCIVESPGRELTAIEESALNSLADHLALALERAERLREAEQESTTDALTGLANRRGLGESLIKTVATARAAGGHVGLCMIDIDHFKRYNDAHGHDQGDQVLRILGEVLRLSVRATDLAGRYGGEEFMLILPGVDRRTVDRITDRIRERLAGVAIDGGPITVSMGVAIFPADRADPGELVKAADVALYQAKQLGRDRVEFASPPTA